MADARVQNSSNTGGSRAISKRSLVLKRFTCDQCNEDSNRRPLPHRVQHALTYLRGNAAEKTCPTVVPTFGG